jgi:hypothetical protein
VVFDFSVFIVLAPRTKRRVVHCWGLRPLSAP